MNKKMVEAIFPGTTDLINSGKCPMCKADISGFRDRLSEKEYIISGLCQKCQDSIWRVIE